MAYKCNLYRNIILESRHSTKKDKRQNLVSHSTSYGRPTTLSKQCQTNRTLYVHYLDRLPYSTFTIIYRSEQLLELQNMKPAEVIDQSPTHHKRPTSKALQHGDGGRRIANDMTASNGHSSHKKRKRVGMDLTSGDGFDHDDGAREIVRMSSSSNSRHLNGATLKSTLPPPSPGWLSESRNVLFPAGIIDFLLLIVASGCSKAADGCM
ncbi:hypothetical protein SeMB42_g04335 [Synchytrium endobioticum]|uniref:Uncharacterized protein n=1 Tax=Synchytrium endobioticum TaxID=286115 RepID=A0A507CZU0_9FUNG|nr:hypothetical protein SeMB42_g04335 [Synchytrium endobioticum]